MLVMTVGSWLITRKLVTEVHISRWQGFLEIVVTTIEEQIKEVGLDNPAKYLGFLGTLFLFIAVSNLCAIIPGYDAPTGSLSTTLALAISVFVAVPFFGIEGQGLGDYLKSYLKPTWIMLPFNLISEVSRTFALAMRLFGNIMSGTMIVAILLTITPLFFPDLHVPARSAHGHGAGLHFQHSRHRLHRGRHANPHSMNQDHQQRKDTYGQHDDYRDRFDHYRRSHHRTGEYRARDWRRAGGLDGLELTGSTA